MLGIWNLESRITNSDDKKCFLFFRWNVKQIGKAFGDEDEEVSDAGSEELEDYWKQEAEAEVRIISVLQIYLSCLQCS